MPTRVTFLISPKKREEAIAVGGADRLSLATRGGGGGAATVATAGTFLAIDAFCDATYTPPVYDYGVNVVYQGGRSLCRWKADRND